MQTEILQASSDNDLARAAELIRAGGLVAIPTETVYGLGASALRDEAVRRVFEVKGRPQDNPLILHLAGPEQIAAWCREVPPAAYALAERFWPGPLTLVLKKAPAVPERITAGLDSVAVRCPDHPATRRLIELAGVPIAAPSANLSGKPSPTTAAHVLHDLEGKIEAVLDGGDCRVGVESTILDLTVSPPRLLRPGGVSLEQLRELLGEVAVDPAVTRALSAGEKPKAPGMKYRHYSPKAPVTILRGPLPAVAAWVNARAGEGTAVLCFAGEEAAFHVPFVLSYGEKDKPETQAEKLFACLRELDREDVTEIFARCPAKTGVGLAVYNRLSKAAGYREIPLAPEKVYGITGGTGAGKTTVLRTLAAQGARVIDCDEVYHRLLESSVPMRRELAAAFGEIETEGRVDRKKLGKVVFGDPEKLAELNRITHRYVTEAVLEELRLAAGEGAPAAAIDAIALIESGLGSLCDLTIAVSAPVEERVRRLVAREGITEDYARLRIAAQKSEDWFREHCDAVLVNDGSKEEFRQKCEDFFRSALNSDF